MRQHKREQSNQSRLIVTIKYQISKHASCTLVGLLYIQFKMPQSNVQWTSVFFFANPSVNVDFSETGWWIPVLFFDHCWTPKLGKVGSENIIAKSGVFRFQSMRRRWIPGYDTWTSPYIKPIADIVMAPRISAIPPFASIISCRLNNRLSRGNWSLGKVPDTGATPGCKTYLGKNDWLVFL
jgi:hypothetical protein